MNKKKILVWITICWAIFSFTFLAVSLILQPLSGSWSYTFSEGLFAYEENSFTSIAISQDGNYIAAAKSNGVFLFSRSNPNPLWNYDQAYSMDVVDISYDGNYIVAGSWEGKLYLFNKFSSQPMWIYDAGYGNSIIDVEISSDGAYIATSIYQVGTFLFQKESPIPLWNVTGNTNMALSANGNYLAISTYSILFLYNTSNSVPLWSFSDADNSAIDPAISSTGEYILISNHSSSTHTCSLMLFNYLSSTPIWSFEMGYEVQIMGIDISFDGNYIIAGTTPDNEGRVYLFNKSDSIPLWDYKLGWFSSWSTLKFSGDGEFILISEELSGFSLFHRSSSIPIWSTPYGYYGSISSSGKEIAVFELNKLFFFNSDNPILIEDFFISYIIIFSLLGVISGFLLLFLLTKRHQRKKLLKEELIQREDLQKILQYSNRVSKKMVRTVLGLDKSTFEEQISKWATEFGFKVDGDYIFINKDELPEFIKELDEKFEEWQELKKKKKA